MSNPKPPTKQIAKYQQQPKWRNQPTKSLRVPEVLLGDIENYARQLDSNGASLKPRTREIEDLSLEKLLELREAIGQLIEQREKESLDRRLELALCYLADRCDGAYAQDGSGFNAGDTGFGKWLAGRIEAKQPILKHHAEAALKMIGKYTLQLERGKLTLPTWEAIAHQYPTHQKPEFSDLDTTPERRLIMAGDGIALISPYDPDELKLIKAVEPTGRWNKSDKSWRFPMEAAEALAETFSSYWLDPNLSGAIELLKQQQEEAEALKLEQVDRAAIEIIDLVEAAELDRPLPCGLTLFDHQKEAVKWLLAHKKGGIHHGGILADDMGLGKTISALVAAKAMQVHTQCSIFVICPASLKDNWLREAERVEVAIEVFSWAKLPKPLETAKYLLIGDEAHYCQDERSQRSQKFKELAESENCLTAWLLTGTPIKNGRPINLYPLLAITKHPLAEDRWEYQRHYCNGHKKWIGKKSVWDNSGASHLDELAKKTEDVILRRTKKECLDLPPKIRSLKSAELEAAQAKAYKAEIDKLVADYRERAKKGEVDEAAEALVTLNILRKVGSEFKVNAAIALAEEIGEQEGQVVIFTEYVESAKALYAALGGEILLGETPVDSRQGIVDRFQSGESKVFTGTIKAGGVGITLTAASNVILVDRPWTPGDAEQAEDRLYRIGQNGTVNAFWVQLGAIDEAIDSLLESKQQRIELVLKGKRKTLQGLQSPSELAKELLEIL